MFKQNIKIIIFFAVLFILWLSVFLFLRKVWFYRDPQREPEKTEKAIISPADGKVIYIRRIENGMVVSEKKGEKIFGKRERDLDKEAPASTLSATFRIFSRKTGFSVWVTITLKDSVRETLLLNIIESWRAKIDLSFLEIP